MEQLHGTCSATISLAAPRLARARSARRAAFDPIAEQAFVAGVLAGEASRMRELIERLTCVRRLLQSRNRSMGFPLNATELDDVEQDTVLTVLRRMSDFRPFAPLESWILGVCTFRLRDAVRSKMKRNRRNAPLEAEVIEACANGEHPMKDWSEVEILLRRLGGVEADVIRLKHFEDLTFDQISERLDLPANTAKSHYYRGLSRLRSMLAGA